MGPDHVVVPREARVRVLTVDTPPQAWTETDTPETCAVGDGRALVTWAEGMQANRLGLIDVAHGHVEAVLKMRSPVMRAYVEDGRVWVKTLSDLHELSLDPFELGRSVRGSGLRWASRLVSLGPGRLAVAMGQGSMCTVVDLATMSVVRRAKIPGPDLSVPLGQGVAVFSLTYAQCRAHDRDGRALGRTRAIPRGNSAVVDGDSIVSLRAKAVPWTHGAEDVIAEKNRGTWEDPEPGDTVQLESQGSLCRLDVHGTVLSEGPDLGLTRLIDVAPDGRLLARRGEVRDPSEMVVIAPDLTTVLATAPWPAWVIARPGLPGLALSCLRANLSAPSIFTGKVHADTLVTLEW